MNKVKDEITQLLEKELKLSEINIRENIEIPKNTNMGDFAFPCFILAKQLKKAPNIIAEELKNKISKLDFKYIEKIEAVNGFLNFTTNKKIIIKELIDEFSKNSKDFGASNIGKGKTILVDYSSPNIAKPFHIGHLKTTILGHCLYNVYKFLGYNTIGINHLGDYGTQFAKLIEAYKLWGNEYDLSENPIDKMANMYIRINSLCEEDLNVLERCRENFKLLEARDDYCIEVWNKFKKVSLQEFEKIYELLGVKFDNINGEAFYSDKMQEVIDKLEKNGKLEESQGAKVVKLEDKQIEVPCIIQKKDGSSIYATRDLAAILYRARTYDFDKCLYVVAIEQSLHFRQVFEVAKFLDLKEKYTNGLEHVSYGMIRLSEGKMSTRKGNFIKVNDLLNESIKKVKEVMEKRDIEDKDEISKQIGIGAIVFNNLFENRIKDQVFDLNQALNFNGETGPYLQYICVRTRSVIEKAGYIPDYKCINVEKLNNDDSIKIINLLNSFNNILNMVIQKNEPSILARYLIDLSQNFSTFYNNNQILCKEKEIQDARIYLTYMTKSVLEKGLNLLGIQVPDKM